MEHVAGGFPLDLDCVAATGSPQGVPETREVGIEIVASPGGRATFPQPFDQRLHTDRPAGAPKQHRQNLAFSAWSQVVLAPLSPQLNRPEQTELHQLPPPVVRSVPRKESDM